MEGRANWPVCWQQLLPLRPVALTDVELPLTDGRFRERRARRSATCFRRSVAKQIFRDSWPIADGPGSGVEEAIAALL